ncbi:MAG TPA: VacJ family lipoprotein [Azospirillaceae bacterium]|nr:VacJ family lipoprotein [Azospirillaceae bacterium]
MSASSLAHRLACATILGACLLAPLQGASAQEAPALSRDSADDPLEPINRGIFWFNEALDVILIRPAAEVYRAVLPTPVQTGIRNVLQNLRSPLTIANQALQGDWKGAEVATGRFLINSTVGLGGIIDVAAKHGLPYEYESFDQTLAVWGVPSGPYLVLPLIGPSTVRDAAGFGVEFLADPAGHVAEGHHWETEFTYTRAGTSVLDARAGYIEVIDDLRKNSVDYYAAMRSLYRQRHEGWTRDGAAADDQFPEIPDYEE